MDDEFQRVETAYESIKGMLRLGAFVPGAAINLSALARHLSFSEEVAGYALARLAGERLVERVDDHIRTFSASPSQVRQLYEWQVVLMGMALNMARDPLNLVGVRAEQRLADRTERLLQQIATDTGNAVLMEVLALNIERLYVARRLENDIIEGCDEELQTLCNAWACGDLSATRVKIERYGRRRAAAAEAISSLWTAMGDAQLSDRQAHLQPHS